MHIVKTAKLIFAILFLILFHELPAAAQTTPVFWITWKSESFVPNSYIGKAIPSAGSNVAVSFELIEGGRPLNLAGQEVRWFVNNVIAEKGIAKKTFSFKTGGSPVVRVELPKFKGGGTLGKSIQIPVRKPEVIITGGGAAKAGGALNLRAIPYFWNIKNLSELSFDWKVNSVSPDGAPANPDLLTIAVPQEARAGDKIITEITVKPYNSSLVASQIKILTVQ